MSLALCPECGHEVSTNAAACPNCGRPTHAPPIVERKVIIAQPPREGFPPWAIVPIVLVGLLLLVVGYMVLRPTDDSANSNLRVNVNSRTSSPARETRTSTVPATETQAPSMPTQTTTVPSTSTSVPNVPAPDKGLVTINAKVAPPNGGPVATRGTKFYLLDKDVESILSEARIEPIEGNSLSSSLGLAAVFPDRYGDFQRSAMAAIGKHVKYSATTGNGGTTDLKGIEPSGYYIFAISKVGRGFALWNQSVSIIAGDNTMNLAPQSVTEVPDPNN